MNFGYISMIVSLAQYKIFSNSPLSENNVLIMINFQIIIEKILTINPSISYLFDQYFTVSCEALGMSYWTYQGWNLDIKNVGYGQSKGSPAQTSDISWKTYVCML